MINNQKILAIIPARKNSKRIIDKNIKILCGKPLIFYTIEVAKKSKYIDRIIVSTDSKKILKISNKYGAETPFLRPSILSGDYSPDLPVLLHTLNWLKDKEDYVPDIVVHLRPTSPLRTVDQIDGAIKLLVENKYFDSVRSVTEQKHTPYKMYFIKDGLLKNIINLKNRKEFFNLPSQCLPRVYRHVGYIDVVRSNIILKNKKLSGKKIAPFIIDNAISGIDTKEDWEYYEYIMKKKYGY
jgi:CMP-N,N'-diacetyllegionaminic acid synthase